MKKFLSLVLALTMMMSLVTINAGAKEFTDDEELNYKEAVDVISEISVVDGYEDGSFKPQNTLTRGAAAKIICNLILGPTTAAELHADTAPYKDVPVSNTFSGYIAYCAKEGIISGYADGSFRPAGTLTGYAFMKMLLGALGYDATYEGYTGGNWSINVAKQAIGIGLNKGLVDEFNGVDFVTREEAALYAFNTLKATMVDYDQKITTNVNGVDVTISQGNAKPVTWTEGINEDGNIKDDDFVQFAEEFFPKLVRKDDNDKFMAPANTWVFDKSEIGTYERTDLIVGTYTTKVTGKDAYDLLKSGVIKDNDLEVYVDGVDAKGEGTLSGSFTTIKRFDKDDMVRSNTTALGATGDGVVTKVYLDTDKDVITFVSINTWLSKATADYSESKEYAPLSVYTGVNSTKTYNVDVEEVANVTDVTKDGFYLVNISWKDNNNGEVAVVSNPEVLEDSTVTKFSASSEGNDKVGSNRYVTKLTTGGEEYKRNVMAYYDKEVLDTYNDTLLTDNTYTVYLDANGYFVGVELFEGTKNYVFITGFDRDSSNLSVKTATASAIFLDGTMKNIQVNVTDTDKNIDKVHNLTGDARHNASHFIKWSTGGYSDLGDGLQTGDSAWAQAGKYGEDGIYDLNQWYTYTEDDGTYTLKPCVRMTKTTYEKTDKTTTIRTDALSVVDDLTTNNRVYGEDETVFLTVDLDVVDTTNTLAKAITEVTGVYTGVQNVDIDVDVDDAQAVAEGQVYTVYDSDYYVIGAVVIGEARGATANYAYIVSGAKSEEIKDDTYYWEFDAVLGGEKQTLTAKSKYKSTIDALTKGTVQELRFDGDYVVSIKDVTKLYTDNRVEIDGQDVYYMRGDLTTNSAAGSTPSATTIWDDPDTLSLQGRTLYITAARTDVGLGLASGAKAVTIQTENGEANVATNFSDVASAISHLADASTAAGFQYDGEVYAVLDSNGVAEWVVFVNHTELITGNQKPGTGTETGIDGLLTYSVQNFNGFGYVNWTVAAPEYAAPGATVTYTVAVKANGTTIAMPSVTTFTAGTSTGTGMWNGVVGDSTAKLTVELVSLTVNNVAVKYVDGDTGNTLYLDSWDNTKDRNTGKLAATPTASLSTSSAAQLSFTVKTDDASSGKLTYTLTGTNGDVTTKTALGAAANAAQTVPGATTTAKGDQFVVVTVYGLNSLTDLYDVTANTTNLTANELAGIDYVDAVGSAQTGTAAKIDNFFTTGAGNTYTDTLQVKFDKVQNITGGDQVKMTVTVVAGNENVSYDVTVTVGGQTYTFNNLDTAKVQWITVNGDIEVSDVVAKPSIKKLTLDETVSAKGLSADGRTLTLTFNQNVTASTAPLKAGSFSVTAGTSHAVITNVAVNGKTIVLTFNTALANGETVQITAADIYGGVSSNTLDGNDTVTINNDGSGYQDCTFS